MFMLPRNIGRYSDPVELERDLDLLYEGSAAQNRAMAAFAPRRRLLAVGYVPLIEPARAIACAAEAVDLGVRAIMFPRLLRASAPRPIQNSTNSGPCSNAPTPPSCCTLGGGGRLLDPAFHHNDMPVTDHLGGGENVRSKDYLAIHHSPEQFLGVLILDGLFDRYPGLRGGCIEQGAGGWCPGYTISTTRNELFAEPKSLSVVSKPSRRSTYGAI